MEFFYVLVVAMNFLMPRVNAAGTVYNEGLLWIAFVIAGGVWLVLHVLKAIGLFTMAKKQGMGWQLHWCAFVPFANTFLMGELGGKLGRNFKHIGLYAMIAELLYCVACGIYYGMTSYAVMNGLYEVVYTDLSTSTMQGGYYSLVFSGLSVTAERLIQAFYYVQYVFSFLSLFAGVLVYIVFFKKYAPTSYIWMVVACAFIPVFIGPLTFAYRNRTPVDYDAYMRARYEQIRRRQQQLYQGRYGSPYDGNTQLPQGSGSPEDDPFGEFSSGQRPSESGSPRSGDDAGKSGTNTNGPDDGFFN